MNVPTAVFNVCDFGAKGDGITVQTQAINEAIRRVSESGGGELYFPSGTYLTGTIVLQSDVILHLSAGARLRSTGEKRDYLPDEKTGISIFEGEENMSGALVWGMGLKNVGLIGQGVLDGNGIRLTAGKDACLYPEGRNHFAGLECGYYARWRPLTLKLVDCENVTLKGIVLTNPASWNVGMIGCKDVFCVGLKIKSHNFYNGDGLDFCSCERVFVSDCSFDCTDDCIALQSAYPDKSCRNVQINNCYFKSLQAGIRVGMACLGDFENIAVSNCIFEECACSGLKIQQCESGKMENLLFRGLVMKNVARPFFFTHNAYECTAKRLRKEGGSEGRGTLKNVLISDCILQNGKPYPNGGLIFDGEDGFELSDFIIEDVFYAFAGEEWKESGIGSLKGHRPEADVYDGRVTGGVFFRNCKNFSVREMRVSCAGRSEGCYFLLENCDGFRFRETNLSAGSLKTVGSENISIS
ncbi:MAG: glycosyl hydrolase family 28 protein [Candidatus Borkfalkiaceae bacterium]|nr:glycosyl hydrolase family 28 protein [Christensenellaceae bacterium]